MVDRKTRISPKIRAAIVDMVDNGRTRSEAANGQQISDDWLYRELRRPEVLAYRNERMEVIRTSAAARTIHRASQLMDSAESEHVRLDATKWVAGLDGIAPISKSEMTVNHKGLGPGLVIVMGGHEPLAIAGTAREVPFVSREKHLSAPIPHPAQLALRDGRYSHLPIPVPHPTLGNILEEGVPVPRPALRGLSDAE